jgi:hypothetical protein
MAAQLETNSISTTPPFAGMSSTQKGCVAKKIQNNARFDEFSQLQGRHPLDAYTWKYKRGIPMGSFCWSAPLMSMPLMSSS